MITMAVGDQYCHRMIMDKRCYPAELYGCIYQNLGPGSAAGEQVGKIVIITTQKGTD
jgi:hypothetical protein